MRRFPLWFYGISYSDVIVVSFMTQNAELTRHVGARPFLARVPPSCSPRSGTFPPGGPQDTFPPPQLKRKKLANPNFNPNPKVERIARF